MPSDILTVLLVDDREDVRAAVRAALERDSRLRVIGEASDGSQGLEIARAEKPDVILLDLAMAGMDGFTALRGLRADVPQSRVVIFSGFERAPLWPQLEQAGAVGYLQKGVPAWELPRRIIELVAVLDTVGDVLREFELELARDTGEVRVARDFLQDIEARHGLDTDDLLTLLTSELVTNALMHGTGAPKVVAQLRTEDVLVEVHDDSPVLPDVRSVGPHTIGGRGLAMVQQLATSWGAAPRPHGKAVWFTLPRRTAEDDT